MRFTIAITALIGLAAASPCKPKSTSTSLTTTAASSTTLKSSSAQSTKDSSSTTSSTYSTTTVTGISKSSSSTSLATIVITTSTHTSMSSSSFSTSVKSSSSSTSTHVSTSATSSSSAKTTSAAPKTTTENTTSAAPKTTSSSTTTTSSTTVKTTVATTPTPSSTSTATTTSSTSSTSTTLNPASASVTNPVALAYYDPNINDGTDGRDPPSGGYECFAGPSANFPAMSTWASFETMFTVLSRDEFSAVDSQTQINQIRTAILSVSQIAKVDPRVILAVVMDESAGNVNVMCTTSPGGVNNCGLMQAYDSSSYDASNSAASIRQMIVDGTQGTTSGPGLVQLLNAEARSGGNIYTALRLYNSGNADATNLSNGEGATDAYVSNIANYLQGWNGYGEGPTNCDFTQPINSYPNND